jgi:hypothetical protein
VFMNMATIYLFVYAGTVSIFLLINTAKVNCFFFSWMWPRQTFVHQCDHRKPYLKNHCSELLYHRIHCLTGNFTTNYQMQKLLRVKRQNDLYHKPERLRKHTKNPPLR